jgi:carbon-monoxide dehydrogenase medium subunit
VIPFDLAEPNTLSEALELLHGADPTVRAAAGCTALMLMMQAGVLKPSCLVSLRRLAPRMSEINTRGAELRIGSLATLSALERSPLIRLNTPVFSRTLRTLANVRVRNVATLGGHLAHADPHMDLPPLLIALGANVVVASRDAERTIPVEELISGYFETTLGDAELVTEVRIPIAAARQAAYLKVTSRSADDWPALGVAVSLETQDAQVRDARVVIGAAVDRPMRLRAAEALLRNVTVDERLFAQAGECAAAEANPVADQHGSAAYKRQLLRVYLARALRQALGYPHSGARA